MYLRKHPEDDNLSEEDLGKIVRPRSEGNEEFQKVSIRMQTYNSIIVGINAYFHRNRMELESLIEHKGMCTLWFTLSEADNYWLNTQSLSLP